MKMTEVKRVSLSNRAPTYFGPKLSGKPKGLGVVAVLPAVHQFFWVPSELTQDKSEDETEAGCQKVRSVVNVMGNAISPINLTAADKACLRVCVVCQQNLQDNNFACDDVAA